LARPTCAAYLQVDALHHKAQSLAFELLAQTLESPPIGNVTVPDELLAGLIEFGTVLEEQQPVLHKLLANGPGVLAVTSRAAAITVATLPIPRRRRRLSAKQGEERLAAILLG
jgi:hypothetical protein